MKLIFPFLILALLLAYVVAEYGMDPDDIRLDAEIDILQAR